jgi:hypothetical protein
MFRLCIFLSAVLALSACQVDVANQPSTSPEQNTVGRNSLSLKEAEQNENPATGLQNRPNFLQPGTCEIIFASRPSLQEAQEYAARMVYRQHIMIFKTADGNFLISEGSLSPDAAQRRMNRQKSLDRMPKDAFCAFGNNFVEALDYRTGQPTSRALQPTNQGQSGGVGLLIVGAVADAAITALADSANQPSSVTSINPSPTENSIPSGGVSTDGDGWVKVDGRTIGRVWSSYGWNISCNNGYNPGYGSSSPFGGSFKADVRNRDEATSILLRACRR